ncbi:MAG: tRNA (guanosine(37)-N1)-methyltransferase TrmD [Phycisphaeraceae bacterium]|nr:tRNA (guanosine(37)-N1)-methyltransferase TrmD [Phycisphaeraceae bacterium]
MRIDVLTLFPEMFASVLGTSILHCASKETGQGRKARAVAREREGKPSQGPAAESNAEGSSGGLRGEGEAHSTLRDAVWHPGGALPGAGGVVSYHLTNIRDYTADKHGKVDKASFGGGPGMVIQCQPVWDAVIAVEAADTRKARRILMTPQGRRLDQKLVEELSREDRLLIIAGHYEGFDQRVIDALQPMTEVSIGDYVLSGGELAAMVLIDAVVRLIPGVLGDDASVADESFASSHQGLLDYPHYTRPRVWMGKEVPDVLLSGDHAAIEAWRQEQARQITQDRRPDLLGDQGKQGQTQP